MRGGLMIPSIAERIGLCEADARTLIFLVENHLLLSKNSLRRDTGDDGIGEIILQPAAEHQRQKRRVGGVDVEEVLLAGAVLDVGEKRPRRGKDVAKLVYHPLESIFHKEKIAG